MCITIDCFFKFLMCSCRAYIAGTATVDASSGHPKCWNWLALFAEGNGNSVSFWRWSFYHFIWSSVIFPQSCHFFRSPFMASKTFLPFLQPAGFALAHFGTQRQGWWRQWPDMLWTWEAIPWNASAFFPFFHEFELMGAAGLNFWWHLHLSVVPDIIKTLNIWHGVVCLSCQIKEDGKSGHRLSGDMQASLKTSGQHPHGRGQPLEMKV